MFIAVVFLKEKLRADDIFGKLYFLLLHDSSFFSRSETKNVHISLVKS